MATQTTDLFLPEDLEDGGAESWSEEAGNGMKPAARRADRRHPRVG